eukprot:g1008.t1
MFYLLLCSSRCRMMMMMMMMIVVKMNVVVTAARSTNPTGRIELGQRDKVDVFDPASYQKIFDMIKKKREEELVERGAEETCTDESCAPPTSLSSDAQEHDGENISVLFLLGVPPVLFFVVSALRTVRSATRKNVSPEKYDESNENSDDRRFVCQVLGAFIREKKGNASSFRINVLASIEKDDMIENVAKWIRRLGDDKLPFQLIPEREQDELIFINVFEAFDLSKILHEKLGQIALGSEGQKAVEACFGHFNRECLVLRNDVAFVCEKTKAPDRRSEETKTKHRIVSVPSYGGFRFVSKDDDDDDDDTKVSSKESQQSKHLESTTSVSTREFISTLDNPNEYFDLANRQRCVLKHGDDGKKRWHVSRRGDDCGGATESQIFEERAIAWIESVDENSKHPWDVEEWRFCKDRVSGKTDMNGDTQMEKSEPVCAAIRNAREICTIKAVRMKPDDVVDAICRRIEARCNGNLSLLPTIAQSALEWWRKMREFERTLREAIKESNPRSLEAALGRASDVGIDKTVSHVVKDAEDRLCELRADKVHEHLTNKPDSMTIKDDPSIGNSTDDNNDAVIPHSVPGNDRKLSIVKIPSPEVINQISDELARVSGINKGEARLMVWKQKMDEISRLDDQRHAWMRHNIKQIADEKRAAENRANTRRENAKKIRADKEAAAKNAMEADRRNNNILSQSKRQFEEKEARRINEKREERARKIAQKRRTQIWAAVRLSIFVDLILFLIVLALSSWGYLGIQQKIDSYYAECSPENSPSMSYASRLLLGSFTMTNSQYCLMTKRLYLFFGSVVVCFGFGKLQHVSPLLTRGLTVLGGFYMLSDHLFAQLDRSRMFLPAIAFNVLAGIALSFFVRVAPSSMRWALAVNVVYPVGALVVGLVSSAWAYGANSAFRCIAGIMLSAIQFAVYGLSGHSGLGEACS